jgi:hypothetical protein
LAKAACRSYSESGFGKQPKFIANIPMHCVHLPRSVNHPDQTYIGLTDDLKNRLKKHNEGGSRHTSKYRPWD